MRHAGRACWPAEEEFSISERQAVVTAPGIVQKGKCWQCFLFPLLFHLGCCSWGLDPSPLSSSHSWHLEALYVFEILGHLIASHIFPTPYFLNSLLTILRTKLLYSRCLFFTQILTISKVNFLQEVWYSLMTYRHPWPAGLAFSLWFSLIYTFKWFLAVSFPLFPQHLSWLLCQHSCCHLSWVWRCHRCSLSHVCTEHTHLNMDEPG